MSEIVEIWKRRRIWWISLACGVSLGCIYRLILDHGLGGEFRGSVLLMTWAYLAVVPLCMGLLVVHIYLHSTPPEAIRWWRWLFLPWLSVAITMAACIVAKWEGVICLIVAAPIMMAFSLMGGLIARVAFGRIRNSPPGALSAIALPLLLIFVEGHLPSPYEIRNVNTEIFIHAPADLVWENIKSVRAIRPSELPGSWVGNIGFPRPVAAILSHEGVGGVRKASFTGGLVFTETVNRWQPEQDLAFSIHANTDLIPKTTLDEHVTIGGAYFDVLDGEYWLERRAGGVLLHLSSHERLSQLT
jgi:hypothetical protein